MLINVKMSIIVGILRFINIINTSLDSLKQDKSILFSIFVVISS